MNWKLARRITLAVICILVIVIAKAGGVFIDFAILFIYGCCRLGPWIFRKGTKYVAKTNADAIVDAQRRKDDKG